MEVMLRQFRRYCVWKTCTRYIHIRWMKATILFALLCFILFKSYTMYTLASKWTDCSQFQDTMNFLEGAVPHFECEILKNNPKSGILNLLQYLKPHWDIDKVIL